MISAARAQGTYQGTCLVHARAQPAYSNIGTCCKLITHGVVGNLAVLLGVAIEFGLAGIVLVLVSQFGEDQFLWPGAQLHSRYQ